MKLHHRLCLLLVAALSTLRVSAQDIPTTFMVKNGEFPWADRLKVWQLSDIPASVDGNGPLPQQNCGSRAITVPADTKYILLGVCNKDVDKFKTDYPDAKPTGESISVVHPDGTGTIPYTIFRVENPVAKVIDKTFVAGLILLQINDKSGASTPPAPSTTP